jgi:hypothetical protein
MTGRSGLSSNLIDKQSIEAPATSASSASINFGVKNPYNLQSEYTNAPWLIDSGASRHMAGSYKLFYDYIADSKRKKCKTCRWLLSNEFGFRKSHVQP